LETEFNQRKENTMKTMFAKRHYEALAAVLAEYRTRNESQLNTRDKVTVAGIENTLIRMLATDNPRFDEPRFRKASAELG